ncbi:MAG: hypothetical protein Q8P30_02205 [Candidatus Uhrbacteria bacterium]|nr:hypothetical protein [Candidatus Uhrbacteria bacterium]
MNEESSKHAKEGKEVKIGGRPLPKGWPNILSGVVAVIIVLLLFALLKPAQMEEGSTGEEDTSNVAAIGAEPVNYIYTPITQWELSERAQGGIQTLTRGQIMLDGIVQDPTDENIVYFAASAYDSSRKQNLISIYSYRTDNYNFERIFRTIYSTGSLDDIASGAVPSFHVAGYDNGKLVILVKDRSILMQECENLYSFAASNPETTSLLTLNITDPYSGFGEFSPGEELMNTATTMKAECENPTPSAE